MQALINSFYKKSNDKNPDLSVKNDKMPIWIF